MSRPILGRFLSVLIIAVAIVLALLVVQRLRIHPQTDDAEVFANLIGIAPEVTGRIVKVNVKDNQFVHKGEVLFVVDPIPYQHALQAARSQQITLEGQIKDLKRTIEAQKSAIVSAAANTNNAQARISTSG